MRGKATHRRGEQGFTLIELIVVIVILGILAAVAVPKYQDLKVEAADAAADGLLGAARGAAAINFSKKLVDSATPEITADATGATYLVGLIEADPAPVAVAGTATFTATIGERTYTYTIDTAEDADSPAKITLAKP